MAELEPAPTRYPIATDEGGFLVMGSPWLRWFALLRDFLSAPTFKGLPEYANNAAALAAGLTAGKLYRTATGEVRVVI